MPTDKKEDPFKRVERAQKRIDNIHEFAAEPKDLYADHVSFFEDHGVLRVVFHCTRPESGDIAGYPTIPVARLSMPFAVFRHLFTRFLDSPDGREAVAIADKRL